MRFKDALHALISELRHNVEGLRKSKKKVNSPSDDPAQEVQQFHGIVQVSGAAFESHDLIWHVREGESFSSRRRV